LRLAGVLRSFETRDGTEGLGTVAFALGLIPLNVSPAFSRWISASGATLFGRTPVLPGKAVASTARWCGSG
jgi:hypothetical protein